MNAVKAERGEENDGIKYPVDSYGTTIKDGDKVGWNYVSFRDDNIRVDHKWVDGVPRYSIGTLTDGRKFVDVDNIPAELINEGDLKKKRDIAVKLIRKRWAGKVIDEDGVRAFVNVATAKEYARSAKKLSEKVISDKLDAASELDKIVATSTNPRIVEDGRDGHKHDGVKAWEYRDILLKVGDRFYSGKVNIKILKNRNKRGENQRLLHDVTDINDITDGVGQLYDTWSRKVSRIGGDDSIVPQSGEEVNGGVRYSVSAAMLDWADSLPDASTTRLSVESGLPNLPYSPDSYVAAMVAGDKLVGNERNPDEYKRLAKVLASSWGRQTVPHGKNGRSAGLCVRLGLSRKSWDKLSALFQVFLIRDLLKVPKLRYISGRPRINRPSNDGLIQMQLPLFVT